MPITTPKVTLIHHTESPDDVVVAAARLCYASDTRELSRKDKDDSSRLLRVLLDMGHLSPLEHASFSFFIEGVSRAMTHQLVRHRIASYSQRSQRYVKHDDFDYVMPPRLHGKVVVTENGDVSAGDYYRETMAWLARRYRKLNEALGDSGEKSNEDARYVLPNACETKIIVTMNARSLLHFFQERLCLRAQWEIRQVAERMLDLAKGIAPVLFADAGPKCIAAGKCPENNMSCGRFLDVRRKYARSD